MDVLKYKCPSYVVEIIDGIEYKIFPLSKHDIDSSISQARRNVGALRNQSIQAYDIELKAQVIERACRLPRKLVFLLTTGKLARLFMKWLELQEEATPDINKLGKHCRWGVMKDPDISEDGAVAHNCESVNDFYGLPVSKLTMGQVAYFLCVKNAFYEMHVKEDKKYTKSWLDKQKQED